MESDQASLQNSSEAGHRGATTRTNTQASVSFFIFYIYSNHTCCMGFRIILNDFMKIVCGLKTGGASAVDGVNVIKTS